MGQKLDARYTGMTVEIFHRGTRVASHIRSYAAYAATTIHEHRPKSHQAHLEWTPSRLINWAATVGPATAERALLLRVYSYQSLKSILKRSLDQQSMLDLGSDQSGPHHDNIRGPHYYDQPPNEFLQ